MKEQDINKHEMLNDEHSKELELLLSEKKTESILTRLLNKEHLKNITYTTFKNIFFRVEELYYSLKNIFDKIELEKYIENTIDIESLEKIFKAKGLDKEFPNFSLQRIKELYDNPPKELKSLYAKGQMKYDDILTRKYIVAILQMVFNQMDLICTFVGSEGSGKCITKDSIINHDGYYLTFEEFDKLEQDKTKYFNILSTNQTFGKATWFKEETNKTFKITLEDGTELEGTPEHRIKVLDIEQGIIWKRLDEIKEEDTCLLSYNTNIYPTTNKKFSFNYTKKKHDSHSKEIIVPVSMNENIGYIIGCIIANGNLYTDNLSISSHLEWMNIKLSNLIESEFGIKTTNTLKNNKWIGIRANSVSLVNFIKSQIGYNSETARYKSIPLSIRQSTKEVQLSFLQGLLNCDSHFDKYNIEYTSASKDLAFMVRTLLMNMGIYCNIKSKQVKTYDHTYWKLIIPKIFTIKILNMFKDKTYKNKNLLEELHIKTSNSNIQRINNDFKQHIRFILNKNSYTKSGKVKVNANYVNVCHKYCKLKENHITTFDKIELLLNEKGNINEIEEFLDYFKDNNLICKKVKQKELINKTQYVYDFTIPSNNTFICNHLINHNTTASTQDTYLVFYLLKEVGLIDYEYNLKNIMYYDLKSVVAGFNKHSKKPFRIFLLDEGNELNRKNWSNPMVDLFFQHLRRGRKHLRIIFINLPQLGELMPSITLSRVNFIFQLEMEMDLKTKLANKGKTKFYILPRFNKIYSYLNKSELDKEFIVNELGKILEDKKKYFQKLPKGLCIHEFERNGVWALNESEYRIQSKIANERFSASGITLTRSEIYHLANNLDLKKLGVKPKTKAYHVLTNLRNKRLKPAVDSDEYSDFESEENNHTGDLLDNENEIE